MEREKTQNSQHHIEGEEQLRDLLQSERYQDSVVLVKEQTHGTELRAQKQTCVNVVNLPLTKEPRRYNGAKTAFSTNGAGTTGQLYANK